MPFALLHLYSSITVTGSPSMDLALPARKNTHFETIQPPSPTAPHQSPASIAAPTRMSPDRPTARGSFIPQGTLNILLAPFLCKLPPTLYYRRLATVSVETTCKIIPEPRLVGDFPNAYEMNLAAESISTSSDSANGRPSLSTPDSPFHPLGLPPEGLHHTSLLPRFKQRITWSLPPPPPTLDHLNPASSSSRTLGRRSAILNKHLLLCCAAPPGTYKPFASVPSGLEIAVSRSARKAILRQFGEILENYKPSEAQKDHELEEVSEMSGVWGYVEEDDAATVRAAVNIKVRSLRALKHSTYSLRI
ncbi:hypothetical protein IAR50_003673 [Cryptococcus sp. DSM 104548]